MAGEETTDQGNIRAEYNNATTGLNLDQTVNQIPKGKLTYALNAAVENFDANSVNYQNEPGNELCINFPEGYQLIGEHSIFEINKHVFFLANPDTGDSEIGYMDNNDCIYHTYINAKCLNFNVNYPIHKSVHKITNCSTEIYWTDGYNQRRFIDINEKPYKLAPGSDPCNPVYTNEIDCNKLNVQPDFSIPQLEVVDVATGGDLEAGTYQFAIQYSDSVSQGYTSYYSITNPTPIANTQLTTPNFNYRVGRSIELQISNLDTTGFFDYFNIAVIKTVNGIASVELIGTYSITNTVQTVTYTGQNVSNIRLSISDIFEKFPYYEVAQDLTVARDILIWDNLTSIDRVNYQQIANQIQLQWETWRIPATENYSDELNATNLRGYLRDEVYAFEIVFLLKNGKQTDGFHIPGRMANGNDLVPVPDTNFDFIGDPDYQVGTVGYSPWWKIYNTATLTGFSPTYSPAQDYKGAYQYGEFAYWESAEKYPCNKEVWGALADQPIRHHKFPDVKVSPVFESALFSSPGSMVMQQDAVFPIGVRLDVSYVATLIANSNLTQEQKDNIAGFKIVRGDRGTNKSIVAKGILRNVGKYNRDETDYYFPNYPYNDLRKDPFLLDKSNAYTADSSFADTISGTCRSINIKSYDSATTIEYINCYTGLLTTYPEDGTTIAQGTTVSLCALGIPVVKTGKACITSNTYKTYKISLDPAPNPFNPRDFSFYPPTNGVIPITDPPPAPYTSWCDYCNETSATLGIWPVACLNDEYNDSSIGAVQGTKPRALNFNVFTILQPGGFNYIQSIVPPLFIGPSANNKGWKIEEVSSQGYDLCTPGPLDAFQDDDVKYRQIFNSPETSFGQPFLGNILKLENVIFGAGKAHFVQVRRNAMYRLATKEAQLDALASADAIATITSPANALALFAAYQAYLTIYINSIPRRNYGWSFNSIASYDYSADIDNGLGIKQRPVDVAQYLIPGVQSVGFGENPINNFQRESSVYLKTTDRTLTYQRPYSTYSVCNTTNNLPFGLSFNITFTYTDIVLGTPLTIVVTPGTCASINSFTYPTASVPAFYTISVTSSSTASYTGPIPALPFPSDSPNVSALNIIDNSRFTLGDKQARPDVSCTAPGKELPINVIGYYASLKNIFVNQWGQIYSYETIDTGFQRDITPLVTPVYETVFGGDTFISRFAFKTKLPFFFDNRVNAPDDSDIFYDEIGNVAYPKYWFSSRSVLEDVSAAGFVLKNFVSFKAHNFDCPNKQQPQSSPGRTFYDGKMYLFAYGIPYFYCESSYNVDLRQAFNNEEGDFWPHVSSSIPDDWVQESNVPIAQDNTYYYNVTFSKQNKENVFTHLPIDWNKICYTNYPFRAIYSEAQETDPDNRSNNWLIYRPISYFDFPQNFGKLTSLDGIQNKAVLARFENKSLLYNTMLTVSTSNPQAAYLGNDTLFRSAPPIDFAETDLGYVGSQHKMLLKIPQGQVTVDAKRGQVFVISGNEAVDISAFGSGLNRFFTDHLAFEILRYFPDVNVDNNYNGLGLHGVYDSKYDRVIITKLDYIPKSDKIKYDPVKQEFYIENVYPQRKTSSTSSTTSSTTTSNTLTTTTTLFPLVSRETVYLTDETYFCNKSWTLSFNFNTKSWISFHSYIPNWYIAENNFFYSGLNDCCTTLDALVGVPTAPTTTTTTTTSAPCQCKTYEVNNFSGGTQYYDYYNCNNVLVSSVAIPGISSQLVCVCNNKIYYNNNVINVALVSASCITTTTSTTTTAYVGCVLVGNACEQTTTTTTSTSTSTTSTTTSSTSTTTTTSTSTSTTTTTTTSYLNNCTNYFVEPIGSIQLSWLECGTGNAAFGSFSTTAYICAVTGSVTITGGSGSVSVAGSCVL